MVVLDRVNENGNARLGFAWWILKDHVGSGSFPRLTCMGGGDSSADRGGDDGGTFRVSLTSGRAARRDEGKGRAGGGEGPSACVHARGGHGALPRSSAACHATTHSLVGQIRMAMAMAMAGWLAGTLGDVTDGNGGAVRRGMAGWSWMDDHHELPTLL